MEGRVSPQSKAVPPLVGRQQTLHALNETVDAVAEGAFQLLGLVGEPGAGKTRLLTELAKAAEDQKFMVLSGRASEFEQPMPFGVVIDALDDHLEMCAPALSEAIGGTATRLLSTVFPSLSALLPDEPGPDADLSGLARYRLYRTIRQLLHEIAGPSGLVLILDDVHWADDTSVELLDHLVRHPPRGRVLIAMAYRPAQVAPRLAALVETAAETIDGHGRQIAVEPLSEEEIAEILGAGVSRAHARRLYEASGGNPFYLEALARMDQHAEPIIDGDAEGGLPRAVQFALEIELGALSSKAAIVAQAAAVAADDFDPSLAAAAAEVSEDVALEALDELVERDIVRPMSARRFRFRHPIVRHVAYRSSAAGWRLAAHARIAGHLARIGASASAQAHHVERAGRFGDEQAITTLVKAGRFVAPHAPATAAHWLKAALRLMPETSEHPESPDANTVPPLRLAVLMELAQAQSISARLAEGRETARTLLRLLPADDPRRGRAARFCALMERQLDRPHEARALLLAELRQIPDPQSAAAVPLRLRLVAESLMRVDVRAAQAVLDLMPDSADDWPPSLVLAVAVMRPMPAYVAGRVSDAVRYAERADALVTAAPDEHLAEWMDAIAWFCWTDTMLGRYETARRRFERSIAIARATGQGYVLTNLLAGLARSCGLLGHLSDAAIAAEEAVEGARLLNSRMQLVFALTQQSLVATWSGDEERGLRCADEAIQTGAGGGEWWGSMARYARAAALISSGQLDSGVESLMEACNRFDSPLLDHGTLLSCCELMAQVESARGQTAEAASCADRAEAIALQDLNVTTGLARLARAHALQSTDPAAAAQRAQEAAETFDAVGLRIDAGRARLRAGIAFAAAGDRGRGRAELRVAAEIFEGCGARSLHGITVREQRRLGVRVPGPTSRSAGPHGLSRREFEVATLVGEGFTNQQIAERLFLSERTVETHLSRIFTKLGVASRTAVVSTLSRPVED